jgi:hypothetical protein
MNKRALGDCALTALTMSSVQPSIVMSTSSGGGFNRCKAQQVRRKSTMRFLVVIITERLIAKGWFPTHHQVI